MGNKIKTVIASVLKPVDDTRMYEKFGLSLQQTNRYEVNIIGFISKNAPKDSDISFYPIFNFSNNSWKRLFASFKFGKYLFKIAPSLIIVTTFELLPLAVFYIFFTPNSRLIYDVRENYALNLLTNKRNNFFSRFTAKTIRFIERYSQKYISLNILAEKKYAHELHFLKSNCLIILNKYKRLPKPINSYANFFSKTIPASYPVLLLNGTISESYGVLEAIHLAKSLISHFPDLLLIIIGHVTNTNLLNELLKIQSSNTYILTLIDRNPIPHGEIIRLVKQVDFGLVAHRPVESIKNCFPTRIYEYMAHQKPFILQDHPYWTSYCDPWECAIHIDFNNFDPHFVAQQMKTRQFYSRGVPNDIYWESEAPKLVKAVDYLFNINC